MQSKVNASARNCSISKMDIWLLCFAVIGIQGCSSLEVFLPYTQILKMKAPTPHWVFGNTTFKEVCGRLEIPTDEEVLAMCSVRDRFNRGLPARNGTMFVYRESAILQSRECTLTNICDYDSRCHAAAILFDVNPHMAHLAAHGMWHYIADERYPERSNGEPVPPLVMMQAGSPDVSWLLKQVSKGGNFLVKISAGDKNSATEVLAESLSWKGLCLLAAGQAMGSTFVALRKLYSLFIDAKKIGDFHEAPMAVLGVLMPHVISGILRTALFFNCLVFQAQLFPICALQMSLSLIFMTGIVSNTSLHWIMFLTTNLGFNPKYQTSKAYLALRVWVVSMAILVAAGTGITVYAVCQRITIISPMVFMVICLFLQLIESFVLVQMAISAARLLDTSKQGSLLTDSDIIRRRKLSMAVKHSGLFLLLSAIGFTVLMTMVSNVDSAALIYLNFAVHEILSTVSTLQIGAVQFYKHIRKPSGNLQPPEFRQAGRKLHLSTIMSVGGSMMRNSGGGYSRSTGTHMGTAI